MMMWGDMSIVECLRGAADIAITARDRLGWTCAITDSVGYGEAIFTKVVDATLAVDPGAYRSRDRLVNALLVAAATIEAAS